MKNCLVIYYSQSGQALDIAMAVTRPLKQQYNLHVEELKPVDPFPFPWKGMSFFQAFPESVLEIPCKLQPLHLDPNLTYDLVILAFPVWYLSPPIPLTGFLQSKEAKKVLNGTPVITLLGVRNMWAMAQDSVKTRIREAGGRLVGNIVLTDPYPNLVSVITIVRWMMTAEKHGKGWYATLFPPAGVPEAAIQDASRFGETILQASEINQFDKLQESLLRQGAVRVNPVLVNIEKRAKIMFGILARWILKKGEYNNPSRIGRLKVFKYYLFTVIYMVSPVASIIFWLAGKMRPEIAKRIVHRYGSVVE